MATFCNHRGLTVVGALPASATDGRHKVPDLELTHTGPHTLAVQRNDHDTQTLRVLMAAPDWLVVQRRNSPAPRASVWNDQFDSIFQSGGG